MSEQETLDFTPVHQITNKLLGLVDVQLPGQRKHIKRIWLDEGGPRMILEGAGTTATQFTVHFVLNTDTGHFVLLQPPETWYDPAEGKAPQALIRVPETRALEFIAAEELSSLIPKLTTEMKLRGGMEMDEYRKALLKDAEEAFGKLPKKGSAEYKAQVPEEEGLLYQLNISFAPVEPSTELRVTKRWNDFGTPFIVLSNAEDKEQEFSIRWIVTDEDSKYLVLNYPPQLTADDDVIPMMVVRFLDADHVETLTPRELENVALACFTEMIVTNRCSADQAIELLGPMLSYQEAKSTWEKK